MPPEELYDLDTDPYEIHNIATSEDQKHRATLQRLRGVLARWIETTDDQGRFPEPAEVVAARGATRPGSDPNAGYTLQEGCERETRHEPRDAALKAIPSRFGLIAGSGLSVGRRLSTQTHHQKTSRMTLSLEELIGRLARRTRGPGSR